MPTEQGFIYLGSGANTSRLNYAVAVAYPTDAPFETTRMVDAGRNAKGEVIGRMVGRSMDKQNMKWDKIKAEKWWELNRWIEAGHFTFYCHYFNFNLGYWQTKLFYAGDVKCSPGLVDGGSGAPRYIKEATLNVIDCGVV